MKLIKGFAILGLGLIINYSTPDSKIQPQIDTTFELQASLLVNDSIPLSKKAWLSSSKFKN